MKYFCVLDNCFLEDVDYNDQNLLNQSAEVLHSIANDLETKIYWCPDIYPINGLFDNSARIYLNKILSTDNNNKAEEKMIKKAI